MRAARSLLIAFAVIGAAAHAQQKPCSPAEAKQAEQAIDRVSTWPQLQKAFKDFRHCDKGAVAEVYTETIVRLAVEWKNVDGFVAEMQNPDFKGFVFAHLRSPAAKPELESVYSRAKASCPAKHETFCAELAEVAKAADK
jgi:hypothetical protein